MILNVFWVLDPCENLKADLSSRNFTYYQLESESCSVLNSLWPHRHSPWNFPGQNTGVGSFSLLQGIFPTQGSNPGLPHCRQVLGAEPQGKPRNTGVGSLSFSRGPSWPRNWCGVFCIAGGFFTSWALREAQLPSAYYEPPEKSR